MCEEEYELEEENWEEFTYFIDCTCEHDSDQHGWSECEIDDCECEGHWEE